MNLYHKMGCQDEHLSYSFSIIYHCHSHLLDEVKRENWTIYAKYAFHLQVLFSLSVSHITLKCFETNVCLGESPFWLAKQKSQYIAREKLNWNKCIRQRSNNRSPYTSLISTRPSFLWWYACFSWQWRERERENISSLKCIHAYGRTEIDRTVDLKKTIFGEHANGSLNEKKERKKDIRSFALELRRQTNEFDLIAWSVRLALTREVCHSYLGDNLNEYTSKA